MSDAPTARPFLKWVGGKTQLLPELRKFYPPRGSFTQYHEPFLGGGAVFFDLVAQGILDPTMNHVFLSDANKELATTYQTLRNSVELVISMLRNHTIQHRIDPQRHFYHVRSMCPEIVMVVAARMIYLNKTCFNGLYRVNRQGTFNVPLGRYKNPNICDEENLRACSAVLTRTTVDCADFRDLRQTVSERDFVYLDPPYVPISATANFASYTNAGFDHIDQESLVDVAHELDSRGAFLLLSNADTPETRKLYKGFNIHSVEARRNVNSAGDKRGKVGEIIVCNDHLKNLLKGISQ
jgi:DNA adenine methylase